MLQVNKPIWLLGFLFGIPTLLLGFLPFISGVSFIPIIILIALFPLQKTIKIPKHLLAFFLLFFTIANISFFLFEKNDYSTYKIGMIFIKIIPMLLIPVFLKEHLNTFIDGLIKSSTLTIIIFLFIVLRSDNSLIANNRIYIGNLNPIWISRIICETTLLLIIIKKKYKYAFLIFMLSLPIIYYTGSKGPLLSLFIVALHYFINKIKTFQKKEQVIYKTILLASILLSSIVLYTILNRLDSNSYFVQRFFRAVPDYARGEVYETSRVVVWPRTISLIKDNFEKLFFVGYGIGNFSLFYTGIKINERLYPHNILLELIIEVGIFFSLLITIFLGKIWTTFKNSSFKYLLSYCIINSMFSGDIILNEYIFFYLSCIMIDNLNHRNLESLYHKIL